MTLILLANRNYLFLDYTYSTFKYLIIIELLLGSSQKALEYNQQLLELFPHDFENNEILVSNPFHLKYISPILLHCLKPCSVRFSPPQTKTIVFLFYF